MPQGAAPLKIVDFHNHYMGPSWELTNLAKLPPAARPAWEATNRNLQSPDALLSSVETAGIAAAQSSNDHRHDSASTTRWRIGRQASWQALRPCHRRRLQRRRRRPRTHPRGQGTQASRRVRGERPRQSPVGRQGNAADAGRRSRARRAGVRASADRPAAGQTLCPHRPDRRALCPRHHQQRGADQYAGGRHLRREPEAPDRRHDARRWAASCWPAASATVRTSAAMRLP